MLARKEQNHACDSRKFKLLTHEKREGHTCSHVGEKRRDVKVKRRQHWQQNAAKRSERGSEEEQMEGKSW
jgi:hypothetical protein